MTVARVRPFVAVLAVALLGAVSELSRAPAFAQSASTISGTVRDSTGSVVPGATVTATNAATRAADHQTATCRIRCAVQIETVIGPSCPPVEMASEQGGGVVTRSETGVFENACVKRDGVWTIQRSAYRRDA